MTNCSIPNCQYSNKNTRRGMCGTHYNKLYKAKISQAEMRAPRPAIIEGDTAMIPLGVNAKQGYAIVDKQYAYLADKYKFTKSHTNNYAVTSSSKTYLHHLIIGKPSKGYSVDHINRDRLDNRHSNLRLVTLKQNIQNAGNQSQNRSGYKGVSPTRSGKWRAYIKPNKIQLTIGTFPSKEEAARAYDREARKYWGEFAYQNIPD